MGAVPFRRTEQPGSGETVRDLVKVEWLGRLVAARVNADDSPPRSVLVTRVFAQLLPRLREIGWVK